MVWYWVDGYGSMLGKKKDTVQCRVEVYGSMLGQRVGCFVGDDKTNRETNKQVFDISKHN